MELVRQDRLGGAVEVWAEGLLQKVRVAGDKSVDRVLIQTTGMLWRSIWASEGTRDERQNDWNREEHFDICLVFWWKFQVNLWEWSTESDSFWRTGAGRRTTLLFIDMSN